MNEATELMEEQLCNLEQTHSVLEAAINWLSVPQRRKEATDLILVAQSMTKEAIKAERESLNLLYKEMDGDLHE